MVFPGFLLQAETGLIAQVSSYSLIVFSYCLNKWRKVFLILFICMAIFISFLKLTHGFAAFAGNTPPTNTFSNFQNNWNYYGMPMGVPGNFQQVPYGMTNMPWYPYPSLPFHSTFPPMQQFYFGPHGQSPYMPSWMQNCPHCMQNFHNNMFPPGPQNNNHPLPMS